VRAAARAGQRNFGENRVQEALAKIEALADLDLDWHLIGHLQSNKAAKEATLFDVIHSIDDASLVRKIDSAAAAAGRTLELLVQVDLAGESTKHGAREAELPAIFDAARTCTSARVSGLMTLPPATSDPEAARPWFRELIRVRDGLQAGGIEPSRLAELSMGMSHDYEIAIEEGSTIVRVGTAIFGKRSAA